jgi:hypothetical protein
VHPRNCHGSFDSHSKVAAFAAYLLFLTSLSAAADHPRPKPVPTKQEQLGMQTLRMAVAIAREADVSSFAQLLTFAGSAVPANNPSLARSYYLQAMDMADNMPLTSPNDLRVSIQNSSVVGIATSNPAFALQLFRRIDKPEWTALPQSDIRYVAASAIVRSFVAKSGTSRADELAALLTYGGDTGEYPYSSASILLSALEARQQGDVISKVFSDALRSVKQDETFRSAPGDFTDLLLSHSNFLPASLCVAGIQAAVEAAQRFDAKEKEQASTEQRTMVLSAGKSRAAISKQATYVALRLLPLASRLDNRLAEELKDHDPDLQAATAGADKDELASLASGQANIVVGGGGVASAQIAGLMSDQAESRDLLELSEHDPDQAIASLSGIQDALIKVRTQVAIARNLIHSDPARAVALLESAWIDSKKITDNKEHLQALVIIADAWSRLDNPGRLLSTVSDGLSLAQKMLSASKNQKVDIFLLRPGVDELGELAALLALVNPQASVELTQSIDSPEVKAYVLLSIARTLLNFPPLSQIKTKS